MSGAASASLPPYVLPELCASDPSALYRRVLAVHKTGVCSVRVACTLLFTALVLLVLYALRGVDQILYLP